MEFVLWLPSEEKLFTFSIIDYGSPPYISVQCVDIAATQAAINYAMAYIWIEKRTETCDEAILQVIDLEYECVVDPAVSACTCCDHARDCFH